MLVTAGASAMREYMYLFYKYEYERNTHMTEETKEERRKQADDMADAAMNGTPRKPAPKCGSQGTPGSAAGNNEAGSGEFELCI